MLLFIVGFLCGVTTVTVWALSKAKDNDNDDWEIK